MMKKTETFLKWSILGIAVVVASCLLWCRTANIQTNDVFDTKYGSFLAAQHAVYVNDFESASLFASKLSDVDNASVNNLRVLSSFLNGILPENVSDLRDDKDISSRIIYDAYLVKNGVWDEMRKRHAKDKSSLFATFRIWPSIAANYKTDTFKFINGLETADSWKNFVRGQIYAHLGKVDKAIDCFGRVDTAFLNINDYRYLMSFYTHENRDDLADKLRQDFTATPGGMFMVAYNDIPDWSEYDGIQNQMAFSLLQTVSHTKVMMYSDLSLVLLRFAQIIAPDSNKDAISFYIGQFLTKRNSDNIKAFGNISQNSPFYPFVMINTVKSDVDIEHLKELLKQNPLFVPALQKVLSNLIKTGDKHTALKIINRALKDENLSPESRAFFTKMRANIYFAFGDYKKAQSDLFYASSVLFNDAELYALQAKIWAEQNRDIETAYEYAMKMVTKSPTDIFAWDVLGRVVYVREGVDAALEVVEGVSEFADSCSSLFEHLGDLYREIGEFDLARDAYNHAIDLSDDGLVVVPNIIKKLRKLK